MYTGSWSKFLFGFILVFFFGFKPYSEAQKIPSDFHHLIVGTYTKPGKSKGIYVYEFNPIKGTSKRIGEADGVKNPSYLALSTDHKYLYAVSETNEGTVSSFAYDSKTGQLHFLNQVSSGGADPCYISVDAQNRYAFVANYSSGSVSAIPLASNGTLNPQIQTLEHRGGGPDTSRQLKPHVHTAYLSPNQKFLFTADLGNDSVNTYSINYFSKNPLRPATFHGVRVDPGNGPRHIVFSPSGNNLYVLQELKAKINFYSFQGGKCTLVQESLLELPSYKGEFRAADIHLSSDGKFLYASNRGSANDIVLFSVLPSGKLKRLGQVSTGGKTPRNFIIDPSGNYLLVANQDSDNVIIFKRNKVTGSLLPTGQKIEVGSPVCLKFD